MTDRLNIAFLGLGVMGGPMAGHLARAGHKVTAYNRTPSRAAAWHKAQSDQGLDVAMAATPAQAAAQQDVVLTCLGNDDDLRAVVLGKNGALAAMQAGALFIDHTSVSATSARMIRTEADRLGLDAVDAPVSGGQAGAQTGKLSVMCGGTDQAMAAAMPIMDAYAARVVHIGDSGAGQTAKMVNQICITGLMASLSEAVRFADAAGLDMDRVLEAVSGGAAQSWQMENRWPTMARGEFDFGFAIDWMRKDLAIALDEGGNLGVPLPVTALVDQFYAEVQAMGGGKQDTSALIRRIPKGSK